ncbi:MAG: hypothetical protein KDI13_05375 [Alphaproteobacteria bacterium]|nr:hypothetical protein [Alphaproteobacteria bacterium]
MFCDMVNEKAVQAAFEENGAAHEPCIHFYDPSYVRAEAILFDPSTRAVHALLHEALHYVGQVPETMSAKFAALEDVSLYADHYSGCTVRMHAPVCVEGRS